MPALVDPAVFEAAQMQLQENRQRKRASWTGPRWLLQGQTVVAGAAMPTMARPLRSEAGSVQEGYIATIAALAPMGIGLTAMRCLTILGSEATTWSRRHGTGCVRCWRTPIRGWRISPALDANPRPHRQLR